MKEGEKLWDVEVVVHVFAAGKTPEDAVQAAARGIREVNHDEFLLVPDEVRYKQCDTWDCENSSPYRADGKIDDETVGDILKKLPDDPIFLRLRGKLKEKP